MKCEYCGGKGTYDPFVGPTAECPKCKGTGQVGSTDECNDSHLDDGRHLGGKTLMPAFAEAMKRAAKPGALVPPPVGAAAAANFKKANAVIGGLVDKFVRVMFRPGLKLQWVEGDITEVESFSSHIQSIKLSEGGYIHDIEMGDVETIHDRTTGAQLWPGTEDRLRAAKQAAKHVTVVSTTLAGTAVRTGDTVEVHTKHATRYIGKLTKISAKTISVELAHGTDIIPISIIDRLIVTFSTKD